MRWSMWIDFAELFAWCDLHASRVGALPYGVRPSYFDRKGFPIPAEIVSPFEQVIPETIAWGKLHDDIEYVRLARDVLPDGSELSTVWLGMDHGFGSGYSSSKRCDSRVKNRPNLGASGARIHVSRVDGFPVAI